MKTSLKPIRIGKTTLITTLTALASLTGCGGPRMTIHAAIEMLEVLGKTRINPTLKESAFSPEAVETHELTTEEPTISANNTIKLLGMPCHLSQPKDENEGGISTSTVKIQGEQCPVEYIVTVDSNLARTITETSFFAKVASVNNVKLRTEIERLKMKVETIPNRAQNITQIKIDLKAQSQEHGEILLSISGEAREKDIHNGVSETSGKLIFDEKEADIKHMSRMIRGIQQDDVFINGAKLNPDERDRVLLALMH